MKFKHTGIKQLIQAYPEHARTVEEDVPHLLVSEFFMRTIQGEGINAGHPAAFLRLQHCTQNCIWCDTTEVWRQGNPYTFAELYDLIESSGLLRDLIRGDRLVLTGGSPLKQQKSLLLFFERFESYFGLVPILDIENECTLMPDPKFVPFIDTWNNSPKLSNSGNPDRLRYQPGVLSYLSSLNNSWFKFVMEKPEDWLEIEKDFIQPGLIYRDQIILMPMGGSIEELEKNRGWTVEIATREGVRFTDRLHVTLWNQLTGV